MGVLAILADLAFGMSYGGTMPAGGGFTTAELSLTRLRQPEFGGNLVAHGALVHDTATSALTQATIFDAEGHFVAHGTSRLAVFPPFEELPEIPDDPEPVRLPEYDTPDPWQRDPGGEVLESEAWSSKSGREILEAQVRGDLPLPPIGRLTGMRVTEVGDGSAVLTMPATEWLATPARTVQGGVTAMLADAALACSIQTTVERGDSFLPIDVKVNYLRPVIPDGTTLRASAEVTHRGRSLAISHATVSNADGKPVAVATGSASVG